MTIHARSAPLLVALLLAPLAGCFTVSTAQYQGITSGLIGCPAEEISIDNPQQSTTLLNWEAKCRGVQYYCSAAGRMVSCKEALPAPGAAPRQPAPPPPPSP